MSFTSLTSKSKQFLKHDRNFLILFSSFFQVFMQGTNVYSNDSVKIEVVPSPLVSSIKGGVYRQVNRQDAVVLDGSESHDPDDSNNKKLR